MFQRLRALTRDAACLGAGLSLFACHAPSDADAKGLLEEAVIDGRPSPSGTREDAVVMLMTEADGNQLACSAALVAENLVLTARHCVSHVTMGPFACNVQGELIDDGSGAGRLGLHLPADDLEFYTGDGEQRVLIARGAKVLSTVSETNCRDDFALVVLDRAVDLPALPLRFEGGARIGEAVTLTGYGLDETMNASAPFEDLSRHTRDDLVILDVGPSDVEDVTSAPPRSVIVRGTAGCVGDSGAPLYSTATGAVLGVYSLLAGNSCETDSAYHLFAHAPDYTALIEDAFRAAGATPGREGDTSVPGAAGSAGGEAGAGGAGGEPSAGAGGEPSAGAGGEPSAGAGGEASVSAGSSGTSGRSARAAVTSTEASGCALSGARTSGRAPLASLLLMAWLVRSRRRSQRRPSSGSRA